MFDISSKSLTNQRIIVLCYVLLCIGSCYYFCFDKNFGKNFRLWIGLKDSGNKYLKNKLLGVLCGFLVGLLIGMINKDILDKPLIMFTSISLSFGILICLIGSDEVAIHVGKVESNIYVNLCIMYGIALGAVAGSYYPLFLDI